MLKRMLLKNNATLVSIIIRDDDLKATGATLEDAYEILNDALLLPHAKEAVLVESDNNKKILKRIKKER
jgi:hypothetical protein